MDKIRTRKELSELLRKKAEEKKIWLNDILRELQTKRVYTRDYSLLNYMNGRSFPRDPQILTALCEVLDVNPETLDLRQLVSPKFHKAYGVSDDHSSLSGSPATPSALPSSSPYPGFAINDGNIIIGTSTAMAVLFSQLEHIVDNPNQDAAVMITGETGTGKELVARAIHYNGGRKDYPFVGLNINSVTGTLLESELFGHRRGSFTDAKTDKVGFFESVDGGTILLDEIGSLPLEAQAKLLRVLQEKYFYRVGDTIPQQFTGRIIAATKEKLAEKVRDKSFREDLWYRMNVVQLHIPPLRDRLDDLPHLFHYFIERYNAHYGTAYSSTMDPGDLNDVRKYAFPGNVREFEHLLTSVIFANPKEMTLLLAPHLRFDPSTSLDPKEISVPQRELSVYEIIARADDPSLPARERFVNAVLKRRNGNINHHDKATLTLYLSSYYDAGGDVRKTAELAGSTRRTTYRTLNMSGCNIGTLKEMYQQMSQYVK